MGERVLFLGAGAAGRFGYFVGGAVEGEGRLGGGPGRGTGGTALRWHIESIEVDEMSERGRCWGSDEVGLG